MREKLELTPVPGVDPEIGRWLDALSRTRRITLDAVAGIDQRTLDWEGPDGRDNAIGSLLYHIAEVQVGWVFFDLRGRTSPPEAVVPLFTQAPRDARGRLTSVLGVPLDEHFQRLERSHAVAMAELRSFTPDDWRTLRSPDGEDYDVSPEWAVFHLVEHEAGHAYQILSTRRRAERLLDV